MGKIKAKQIALAAAFTSGTGEALDIAEGGVLEAHIGFGAVSAAKLSPGAKASVLQSRYFVEDLVGVDRSAPNGKSIDATAWAELDFGTVAGVIGGTDNEGIPVLLGSAGAGDGHVWNSLDGTDGRVSPTSDPGYYMVRIADANGEQIYDANHNVVWGVFTCNERTTGGFYYLRFYSGEWGSGTETAYALTQAFKLIYPRNTNLGNMSRTALRSGFANLSVVASGVGSGEIDTAQLADGAVTKAKLNADVAGDGIAGGAGTALSVDLTSLSGLEFDDGALRAKVDGSTVERDTSGNLAVVAGGIGTTQLAATCVTAAKLGSDVAGNGLTGGNGSALAVLAVNTSVDVSSSGVKAAVPVTADKALNPTGAISTDDADTGLAIAQTPAAGSYVRVALNGIGVELGNGVKTKDCYFTGDAGTTARAISAIVATDELYWNAVVSGVNLSTSDEIDLDYNTTA